MSNAFAPIVRARPCPIFGRPVHRRGRPLDYSPILLLKLFGFRIAPDTLSSTGLRRRPARHYPCLWIQRPSSERWRDFNPPDSRATQHTLRPRPTPVVTAACCDVEAATLVINGSPPITRTTLPTCRAHYPGGLSGCTCRLLPRLCSLPQLAGGSASTLSLSRPAQALLTLRPAGSLSRPTATFVARLQPSRLPDQAAR